MIGTRLAHYEITGHLGSGGMGEVYQATDAKLGRSVAIKLLPEAFARDAERVARFEREARVLASLNHPNIAGIHGLETGVEGVSPTGDVRPPVSFLVMELVPGETLAERVARGPVPVAEALTIARQIAEALEAAHEKGIIHRDLKPANIKIKGAWGPTPTRLPDGRLAPTRSTSDITDGTVKVLDFGLAKAYETDAPAVNLSNSPTMTKQLAATEVGMILGTAAYMSPEQAKGRPVDKRTDIFAFGCVLYEMLTGHRAFEGDDVTDILSAVLRTEPDWTRLPPDVPPAVRKLLQLCLEKNARNRRSDATDVRLDIDAALKEPEAQPVPAIAAQATARQTRVAWIVATLAALVAVGSAIAAVLLLLAPLPAEMRLEITTPSTAAPLEFALSPDGEKIAFIASGNGPQRLWVRALNKTDAQPLPGTEGADFPFWSHDSRSIGFFASGNLYRIDLSGGPPQWLASAIVGRGGAWNADGTILFSRGQGNPLMKIAASGGTPVPLTKVGGSSAFNSFPHFLPDGRRFVFYVTAAGLEAASLYLGSLDGGEPKRLRDTADSSAEYLAGFLVFLRRTTLVAQRLDLPRGVLTGDPETLADLVGCTAGGGASGERSFSVSDEGLVAYRSGCSLRQLTWVDRAGTVVGMVGAPDAYALSYPELSSDDARVAVQRRDRDNQDVWLMDVAHGGLKNLTSDPASDTVLCGHPMAVSPLRRAEGRALCLGLGPRGCGSGLGVDARAGRITGKTCPPV